MAKHARGTKLGRFFDSAVSFITGEWILEWSPYTANGGAVVAARTLWLTLCVYLPALLLKLTLADDRTADFDLRQGLADFVDTLPWLGAIFGGAYLAFYTRFSSQWTYLANLYNQIVQAQTALPDTATERQLGTLASWKAGFIEDAEDLHLATKPMFLVAIRHWGKDTTVASKFKNNTVGGAERLEALLERLDNIWEQADSEAREMARKLPGTKLPAA